MSGRAAFLRALEGDPGAPLWARAALAALAPAGWVYGTAMNVRRALYGGGLLKSEIPPCPVVSIGNLTLGGTGKTPAVAWVLERLIEAGIRPGAVSRGIRRIGGGCECGERRRGKDALLPSGFGRGGDAGAEVPLRSHRHGAGSPGGGAAGGGAGRGSDPLGRRFPAPCPRAEPGHRPAQGRAPPRQWARISGGSAPGVRSGAGLRPRHPPHGWCRPRGRGRTRGKREGGSPRPRRKSVRRFARARGAA